MAKKFNAPNPGIIQVVDILFGVNNSNANISKKGNNFNINGCNSNNLLIE